ncbi:Sepiapterin reductase [Holothuria leucospilota]|uniref:Sepiapterin reductase n=1 Tax=Holothuria leucospilota TaxID=206669 RepID=A0A9Q1H3E5_HOLLE|nr:Sepiapterin reductase [Holothuria leucospilota]
MSSLKVPTFVIVTGAGRGIGREITIQLARKVDPGSYIYLIDVQQDGIEDTARVIKQDVNDDKLKVRRLVADLSDDKSVTELNSFIFKDDLNASMFSHVILVHNAGALGFIEKHARELNNVEAIQKYFLLNLTSAILLTSGFLRHFHNKCDARKTVVQITSQAATSPIQSLHLYGTMKAGRDMFFRVMALEEPDVKFLSFNPGSVDTKMHRDAHGSHCAMFRTILEKVKKHPCFLTPEQAASALIKTIEEDKYESAVTVQSYDVLGMKVDL